MSEELNLPLVAVAIGFNDGANKGFWRIQPRDGQGQWMEMGGGVTWFGRDSSGNWTNIPGIYVGPTGKPGMARILVKGQSKKGIPDKVYEVPSHLLQNVEARLSEEYVKSKGVKLPTKDIFGNSIGLSPNEIPQLSDIKSYDITSEDERLARGELTPEERAAEQDGREKSPLAKLPGGFESKNQQEAKDLLRESGIEPDEFDKDADAAPADEATDVPELDLAPELDDAAPSGDAADKAVADALAKAAYGDEIPDVDAIVRAAQAPVKPKTVQTPIADIKPGDIIQLKPDKVNVQDFKVTSNKTRTLLDGSTVYDLQVDSNGQSLKVTKDGVPANATLSKYDIPAKPAAAPAAPAAPVAKPAAKKSPAAPKAPAAKPVTPAPADSGKTDDKTVAPVTAPTTATPTDSDKTLTPKKKVTTGTKKPKNQATKAALAKGRADDGKDISPDPTKSLSDYRKKEITPLFDEDGKPLFTGKTDDQGKPIPVEDPDAIINALLEENPQAKVGKDGAVILERGDYIDSDGTKYKYEVAVQKTHDNKFMERYSFTNAATGDRKDYYHYDYKDSFRGIYGEKNGVMVFRDQLLGRSTPGNPKSTEIQKWFGKYTSLDRRVRYFRNKSGVGKQIDDQTLAEAKNMKLLTSDEIVRKYLNGRPRTLNRNGTVDQKFLQSFWEIIDEDSSATNPQALEAMVQLLGRLPDNEESRGLLISNLRKTIKERYEGKPNADRLGIYANNIEVQIMARDFDLRDLHRRPWASRDGRTIIETGDKVRYYNNEGETSVGVVVKPNRPIAGYDDTVRIRFADGTTANIIATKYLDRLTGTDEEDTPSTKYTPSLRGDAMRAARGVIVTPGAPAGKSKSSRNSSNSSLDFGDKERQQDDGTDGQSSDVADPYLGNAGTPADQTNATTDANAPSVGNVVLLDTGDAYYSEDGEYLGTVVETIEVEANDGGEPGIAVYYVDENGDEHYEVLEKSDNRGPK